MWQDDVMFNACRMLHNKLFGEEVDFILRFTHVKLPFTYLFWASVFFREVCGHLVEGVYLADNPSKLRPIPELFRSLILYDTVPRQIVHEEEAILPGDSTYSQLYALYMCLQTQNIFAISESLEEYDDNEVPESSEQATSGKEKAQNHLNELISSVSDSISIALNFLVTLPSGPRVLDDPRAALLEILAISTIGQDTLNVFSYERKILRKSSSIWRPEKNGGIGLFTHETLSLNAIIWPGSRLLITYTWFMVLYEWCTKLQNLHGPGTIQELQGRSYVAESYIEIREADSTLVGLPGYLT
ncbi:hypothetical protein M422DRAFT_40975 [Sphaerobolus stellatus SS14]|nr:hypothetical protein M422DRAFT_40975 [Sphaerobolus stellatus SS14]